MARYDVEESSGYAPNHAAVPAPVNTPVMFVAPQQRTTASGEIWIAVSCQDTHYGGCRVWLSNDTAHYYEIGVINGRSHQGVLTADLPAADDIDTAHTLSVDMSMSGSLLEEAGQETADRLDSLCYVGGELLAFRDAEPTDTDRYALSYLHRGLYGTNAGAALNAPFVVLTGPLLRYRFNKQAVGGTLYFKFQGFNIYGGGLQDLADCDEYAFSVDSDGGVKALLSDIPVYSPGDNVTIIDNVISASTGSGVSYIPMVFDGFNADIVCLTGTRKVPNFVTNDNGNFYYIGVPANG